MNIPVNLFMWIMAFLPIAALLILMIKCGWGATEAAPECTDHIDHCMDCNSDVSGWR